ncbi:MAG: preprotein translocase subunit SecG [Deltaproteobacteria bacterium]
METALTILHVLVCIGMLPVILLQSGKGGGVSAVFGGGGAGTVFGSRGASNFLTKMTTGCAIVFMVTSMSLSWLSSRDRSVVSDIKTEQTTESTTAPSGDQATPPAASSTAAQ